VYHTHSSPPLGSGSPDLSSDARMNGPVLRPWGCTVEVSSGVATVAFCACGGHGKARVLVHSGWHEKLAAPTSLDEEEGAPREPDPIGVGKKVWPVETIVTCQNRQNFSGHQAVLLSPTGIIFLA
jgi:hypothetical protein